MLQSADPRRELDFGERARGGGEERDGRAGCGAGAVLGAEEEAAAAGYRGTVAVVGVGVACGESVAVLRSDPCCVFSELCGASREESAADQGREAAETARSVFLLFLVWSVQEGGCGSGCMICGCCFKFSLQRMWLQG